jgi:hypothetical protein
MIELPYDQIEAYENKMNQLKWVEAKKEGDKEPGTVVPAPVAPVLSETKRTDEKSKKMQPILKVIFKLNLEKELA